MQHLHLPAACVHSSWTTNMVNGLAGSQSHYGEDIPLEWRERELPLTSYFINTHTQNAQLAH